MYERDIMTTKIDEFLNKYKLNIDEERFSNECYKFVYEMKLGLKEQDRGLPMVHTYISDEGILPAGEKIVVVDAGGTNLRVAVVSFDEKRKPIIANYNRYSMPGIESEITADELFTEIANYIVPYLHECKNIGICFSYMSESTPDKDAKVIELSKEVKVKDISGKLVCAEIKKVLERKGITGTTFTLVNDSVATLLAGKIFSTFSNEFIGYILGTGQNICYSEKLNNIPRLTKRNAFEKTMIINVESGYYDRYERGSLDEELDSESENPSSHILEKMMSGGYLGNLTLRVLKRAAAEELFTSDVLPKLEKLKELPLFLLDEFYSDIHVKNVLTECFGSSKDNILMSRFLIDAVMKRAAYLNAVVIGATLIKSETGTNKDRPTVICIDGTTYYKTLWLKDHISDYFRRLVRDKLNRFFTEIRIEDAPIIGTAVAGINRLF